MPWIASSRSAVDVVLAQPVERVVDQEAAHLVAARAVEVDRLAPRRAVAVGEVRPEVAAGSCPPGRGGCRRRRARPRARARGRRRPDAAGRRARRSSTAARTGRRRRSPSCARPGNSATGISSTAVTPRSRRCRQLGIDGVERAFGRERADVQLVDHEAAQGRASEFAVGPGERLRIDEARWPVHAVRLGARARIGTLLVAVDHEQVVVACAPVAELDLEHVVGCALQLERARRFGPLDRDRARVRSPDAEPHASVGQELRAEIGDQLTLRFLRKMPSFRLR